MREPVNAAKSKKQCQAPGGRETVVDQEKWDPRAALGTLTAGPNMLSVWLPFLTSLSCALDSALPLLAAAWLVRLTGCAASFFLFLFLFLSSPLISFRLFSSPLSLSLSFFVSKGSVNFPLPHLTHSICCCIIPDCLVPTLQLMESPAPGVSVYPARFSPH